MVQNQREVIETEKTGRIHKRRRNEMINIAIDGPAGAGKSTIAKQLAKKLSYIYVDTGAMYRAVGLFVYSSIGDKIYEKSKWEPFIERNLHKLSIRLSYEPDGQHIWINGEDVSDQIRTALMGKFASIVSANLKVREFMVKEQQALAVENPVVMDGRDIGTHVLPQAQVKVFLTASVEVRAKRRLMQLEAKGEEASLEQLKKEISERDKRDMEREHAPLRQAEDAVVIDTSSMTIDEVVDAIERLYESVKEGESHGGSGC